MLLREADGAETAKRALNRNEGTLIAIQVKKRDTVMPSWTERMGPGGKPTWTVVNFQVKQTGRWRLTTPNGLQQLEQGCAPIAAADGPVSRIRRLVIDLVLKYGLGGSG